MTRIAVIADSHFCERRRFGECARVHDWIAGDIAQRKVDLVCHAGDVYDAKSTPTERHAVSEWLRRVTDIAPVVIVRGNHDALGDLPLLAKLRTRHQIVVEEACAVHHVAGVTIACVAWPRSSALLATLGATSHDVAATAARQALQSILAAMADELATAAGPRVLLSHAMVSGAVTSHGQPLVGCDMELGLAELAMARAHVCLLGHIHKSQSWDFDGATMIYPGSPYRTSYGEMESKGYLLVDIDGDSVATEFVETPATPMVLLDATFDAEQGLVFDGPADGCIGAEVRLRYRVSQDQRDAARAAVADYRDRLLADGVLACKVEETVCAETRARAPEVATAKTLSDKLEAYWGAKGWDPGVRRDALLWKVWKVENETRENQ